MKIIVDAMGGDNAPQAPVMGAVEANREYGVGVILVGRGETILKVLEDNQSFFPDYNGVFLVRDDLLEKYPEVADILNQLAGKIPTEQMAELTYQVDVEGRTVDEVAREFLVSLGLLEA